MTGGGRFSGTYSPVAGSGRTVGERQAPPEARPRNTSKSWPSRSRMGWHGYCGLCGTMLDFYPRWLSERLGHAVEPVYFATWRISSWQPPLEPAEREVVTQVLQLRKDARYSIRAFVVMDDHVHVLVQCRRGEVDAVIESMKSYSAHRLREVHGRSGAVWQHESFGRPIRGPEDLRLRTEYIVSNPWKRWPFIEGYPWVWEAGARARRRRLAAAS